MLVRTRRWRETQAKPLIQVLLLFTVLREVTPKQGIVLGLLALVFLSLFGGVYYFSKKIEEAEGKKTLLSSGGTLT